MDKNKNLSWLLSILEKELKNDNSPRAKSAIQHILLQLSNTPIGVMEQKEVERLKAEFQEP